MKLDMTKKYSSFLLLLAALLLTSCHPTKKEAASPDKFDTLKVAFTQPLSPGDAKSPKYSCDISLLYMVSADTLRQAAVNRAIIKAAFDFDSLTLKQAIDSFKLAALAEYRDILPEYNNEKQAGTVGSWYDHNFKIETTVSDGKEGVWNYILYNYYMYGGAHPTNYYVYMNFDKETGRELTFGDVFVDNFQDAINTKLIKVLSRKLGVTTLDEIQKKGYLTMNDMFPSENFLLAKDSIKFMYNAYEIAPYSSGPMLLSLSYNDIKSLLKQNDRP